MSLPPNTMSASEQRGGTKCPWGTFTKKPFSEQRKDYQRKKQQKRGEAEKNLKYEAPNPKQIQNTDAPMFKKKCWLKPANNNILVIEIWRICVCLGFRYWDLGNAESRNQWLGFLISESYAQKWSDSLPGYGLLYRIPPHNAGNLGDLCRHTCCDSRS